ncbi:MAG: hypothetical protein IJ446_04060 [Oscillospiraceae bacterium]|nr:hypothetical protein [Oscillospiraceae bacterium]
MKKIISACIDQILWFDSTDSFNMFKEQLSRGDRKYTILSEEKNSDGSLNIHVLRQYNNAPFLDKE